MVYKNGSQRKHTFLMGELFSGPGGLALAATNSSITNGPKNYTISHGWSTDYHSDACETYRHNICPVDPQSVICEDIRKLNLASLRKIAAIDALSFGFPCNDFSVVGEQKGVNGEFGPLYTYCIRALRCFKPKWFLAENVGGLKNSNDGSIFRRILDDLYNEGYDVIPHLYKFEEYGVPQSRHRIIMIGIRHDLDVFFKVPSAEPYSHLDTSSRSALMNPPIPLNAANNELTKQSETVVKRLRHIRPGENVFSANLPEHLRLKVKGARISQIYKRLHPDKPAYTVTGSGGGGTHVYHWSENRALTNRERARLQTFPDDFVFHGSKESVRRQIGMAVPPAGARVVFEAVLKSFAGIDYPFVDPNLACRIRPSRLHLYNRKSLHQLMMPYLQQVCVSNR